MDFFVHRFSLSKANEIMTQLYIFYFISKHILLHERIDNFHWHSEGTCEVFPLHGNINWIGLRGSSSIGTTYHPLDAEPEMGVLALLP